MYFRLSCMREVEDIWYIMKVFPMHVYTKKMVRCMYVMYVNHRYNHIIPYMHLIIYTIVYMDRYIWIALALLIGNSWHTIDVTAINYIWSHSDWTIVLCFGLMVLGVLIIASYNFCGLIFQRPTSLKNSN